MLDKFIPGEDEPWRVQDNFNSLVPHPGDQCITVQFLYDEPHMSIISEVFAEGDRITVDIVMPDQFDYHDTFVINECVPDGATFVEMQSYEDGSYSVTFFSIT